MEEAMPVWSMVKLLYLPLEFTVNLKILLKDKPLVRAGGDGCSVKELLKPEVSFGKLERLAPCSTRDGASVLRPVRSIVSRDCVMSSRVMIPVTSKAQFLKPLFESRHVVALTI